MYFRGQRKSASDVSLSECIETGRDGNALSLMDVICSEEDLFEQLSEKEIYGRLHAAVNTCLTPREQRIILLRYGLGNRGRSPCSAASAAATSAASKNAPCRSWRTR